MHKVLIGLLLAATAASPALADKGGRGHGGGWKHDGGGEGRGGWKHDGGGEGRDRGKHGGGEDRGNWVRGNDERRGGWKHAERGRPDNGRWREARVERRWDRQDWSGGPVRVVRYDDKWARKAWKREAKEERKREREWAHAQRFRPAERYVEVERYAPRPVVRYAEPVRYIERSYGPSSYPAYYQAPARSWTPAYTTYAPTYYQSAADYARDSYWPDDYGSTRYSPIAPAYADSGGGLLGGGLLGALLPVLLQGGIGNSLGLNGLGLNGLGLNGLGLNGLGGYGSPDIYPLQLASYAPYSAGNTDLASLLLPSLIGGGSLF